MGTIVDTAVKDMHAIAIAPRLKGDAYLAKRFSQEIEKLTDRSQVSTLPQSVQFLESVEFSADVLPKEQRNKRKTPVAKEDATAVTALAVPGIVNYQESVSPPSPPVTGESDALHQTNSAQVAPETELLASSNERSRRNSNMLGSHSYRNNLVAALIERPAAALSTAVSMQAEALLPQSVQFLESVETSAAAPVEASYGKGKTFAEDATAVTALAVPGGGHYKDITSPPATEKAVVLRQPNPPPVVPETQKTAQENSVYFFRSWGANSSVTITQRNNVGQLLLQPSNTVTEQRLQQSNPPDHVSLLNSDGQQQRQKNQPESDEDVDE